MMAGVYMRTGPRILLLAAPLLVLPLITALYTHLNMDRQLFVERLGCGCDPGFNTNHLSLIICGVLLSGAAASWWGAARGLAHAWFWALSAGFVVLGAVFFWRFMYYNSWL